MNKIQIENNKSIVLTIQTNQSIQQFVSKFHLVFNFLSNQN